MGIVYAVLHYLSFPVALTCNEILLNPIHSDLSMLLEHMSHSYCNNIC